MHDYLFSVEVVRFAFAFGVVVSMVLYERRHLTTGSIVVPGYIAIFLIQPLVILATFLNAFLSYWFVNRVLPRWVLLYGRNKFTVLALFSIAVQAVMLRISPSGPYLWESDVPYLVGAGYVVPALVAHDMARQGIKKTGKSVMMAGVIVVIPIALALFAGLPGVNDLAPLTGFGVLIVRPVWIPLAVLLSAAAGWGLLHNHGLRSGGFVGAAYVGMLAGSPLQLLFVVGVGFIAYLVVTRLLMGWMILFGRRKFATMLLLSAMMSWGGIWFGQAVLGYEVNYYMTLGSVALTPLFVPGLIANDMERSNPARVLVGLILGSLFVIPATLTVESVFDAGRVPLLLLLAALTVGSIIFRPQIVAIGATVVRGVWNLVFGRGGRHRITADHVIPPTRIVISLSTPVSAVAVAPSPDPASDEEREDLASVA